MHWHAGLGKDEGLRTYFVAKLTALINNDWPGLGMEVDWKYSLTGYSA